MPVPGPSPARALAHGAGVIFVTREQSLAIIFDAGHESKAYYVEVIANPDKLLRETNFGNDMSMRKVILTGTPGHRHVTVPAWNGFDPEG
jgi:hypothetical protein